MQLKNLFIVIATLYKIDYVNRKGYIDPACTSLPCNWNKVSKKTIESKRISEIVVRKTLRSQIDKKEGEEEDSEGIRGRLLNEYDPRQMHRRIVSDDFVTDLYKVTLTSVLFKCISMEDDDVSGKIYSLPDFANGVLEKVSDNTTDEKISYFLQSLPTTPRNANEMERRTRGQSDNDLWITARQGRLTASNHHDSTISFKKEAKIYPRSKLYRGDEITRVLP